MAVAAICVPAAILRNKRIIEVFDIGIIKQRMLEVRRHFN